MTDPGSPFCQRWQGGRHSWRHTSEGGFDPRRYEVALIDVDKPVKAFVEAHHYSRSFGAAVQRTGLYEGDRLVGVAVFGGPMNDLVLTNSFPHLTPYDESLELTRFVLLDEVPANAETWFLARSFQLVAERGLRGVVSFADPVPRRAENGTLLSPGHVGTIYQASNGYHAKERSTARSHWQTPGGLIVSPRTLQKVRKQERGHEYAEQQLVDLGARRRTAGEDPRAWLREALHATCRTVRHPGNYRYLFRLGTRAERSRTVITMPLTAYPKQLQPAA